MLNTAVWTTAIGNSHTLSASPLMQDFEEEEVVPTPVHGYGVTHTSYPEKPYVYGKSTAWARRQLALSQLSLHRTTT